MKKPVKGGDGRRSILVVEDEMLIAMELAGALTAGGFRVLGPAGSVDHALDLLRDERPDGAVLDVTLRHERVTPVALLLKSRGVPSGCFWKVNVGSKRIARHEAGRGAGDKQKT